jgi:hypothetical protein
MDQTREVSGEGKKKEMERSGSLDLPWLGPCEDVRDVIGWNCYHDFWHLTLTLILRIVCTLVFSMDISQLQLMIMSQHFYT